MMDTPIFVGKVKITLQEKQCGPTLDSTFWFLPLSLTCFCLLMIMSTVPLSAGAVTT